MTRPPIIFNVNYHQYYGPDFVPQNDKEKELVKQSKFYHCMEGDAISYVTRKGACDKSPDEEQEMLDNLIQHTDQSPRDILSYANERPGSTGAFGPNGDYSKKELSNLRKIIQETKATIYSSVLSFDTDYGTQFCNSKKQAKNIIQNTCNKMFEESGLDPSNVIWYAAFHNNTEHPHIHLNFWEKEPLKISSNGKLKFTKSLDKNGIAQYPANVYQFNKENNFDFFKLRDEIRSGVTQNLKKDVFTSELKKLNDTLGKVETVQYARLSNTDKLLINNAFENIIKSSPELNEKYNLYIHELNQSQRDMINFRKKLFNKNNKFPIPAYVKNFAKVRIGELYNRCGNTILNSLKQFQSEGLDQIKYNKKNYNQSISGIRSKTINRKINKSKSHSLFASTIAALATDVNEERGYLFDRAVREYYAKIEQEAREYEKQKEKDKYAEKK